MNHSTDSAMFVTAVPTAGTYYLGVASTGNGPGSGDDDGLYNLIFGFDSPASFSSATIPEPNAFSLIAFSAILIARMRRNYLLT